MDGRRGNKGYNECFEIMAFVIRKTYRDKTDGEIIKIVDLVYFVALNNYGYRKDHLIKHSVLQSNNWEPYPLKQENFDILYTKLTQ